MLFAESRKTKALQKLQTSVESVPTQALPSQDTCPKSRATPENAFGLKNYLPVQTIGEDSNSIRQHKLWLQLEFQKSRSQDTQKICLLMNLTFLDRRDLIVNALISVNQLRQEYPFVFGVQQVKINIEIVD